MKIYTSVLDALKKFNQKESWLNELSPYYKRSEATCRAGLALSIVRSSSASYTQYAGIALEHCRQAMKVDPFNALAHAVYGYLLDRCLDKYEEAREYLEYAIHLDQYNHKLIHEPNKNKNRKVLHTRLGCIHVWYAMLLANFDKEFAEIEIQAEKKKI